jgi:hypothetical protein
MVRIINPEDYLIKDIIIAKDGKHKYIAILQNKKTGRDRQVPFGSIQHQHYRDSLGYYADLDHLDKKRQENFLKRHAKNITHKFSSGWFSANFLWN